MLTSGEKPATWGRSSGTAADTAHMAVLCNVVQWKEMGTYIVTWYYMLNATITTCWMLPSN